MTDKTNQAASHVLTQALAALDAAMWAMNDAGWHGDAVSEQCRRAAIAIKEWLQRPQDATEPIKGHVIAQTVNEMAAPDAVQIRSDAIEESARIDFRFHGCNPFEEG